jgi:hypothetical protein
MQAESVLTDLELRVRPTDYRELFAAGNDRAKVLFYCARLRLLWYQLQPIAQLELADVEGIADDEKYSEVLSELAAPACLVITDYRQRHELLHSDFANSSHYGLESMLAADFFLPGLIGKLAVVRTSSEVARLARSAYEERAADGSLDPVFLSILADALEDAEECTLPAQVVTLRRRIMRYLRGESACIVCQGSGVHYPSLLPLTCDNCGGSGYRKAVLSRYRGFWPLDVLLGKRLPY